MEKLEIDRSGEFPIETFGNNHCGTDTKFTIRYKAICVCSPRLDKRGFLFEQTKVQEYFESIKKTDKSCERLTEWCLEGLHQHIMQENPGCEIYSLKLTLSPHPYAASMTCSWEQDAKVADGYVKDEEADTHQKTNGHHRTHADS
jgi:hypothetical protein